MLIYLKEEKVVHVRELGRCIMLFLSHGKRRRVYGYKVVEFEKRVVVVVCKEGIW